MAAPRIVRSASARRDLDDIWDYLAAEAGPEIADVVLARIFEALHRAADRPLLYPQRPEYVGRPRRINILRYAILYEALPEGDGTFLWRVIHGARDLPHLVVRPPPPDENT
jgi:plasmid stabilization system protein ParE